jgi:hypothetical protein
MFKSQGFRMAALAGLSLFVVSSVADAGGRRHHHQDQAAPEDGIRVGVLNCQVGPGEGYVLGSKKPLRCFFDSASGRKEHYEGVIEKVGVDIGVTDGGTLSWAVVAPTANVRRGALSGDYIGATAEATVGAGVGVNVLVGGSNDTISLQPVSAQVQTGLNAAAGVAQLKLRPRV